MTAFPSKILDYVSISGSSTGIIATSGGGWGDILKGNEVSNL
jgi:hypothetical protein